MHPLYNGRVLRCLFVLAFLISLGTGCSAPANRIKPVVEVVCPPDGSVIEPGALVALRVAATSSMNISRIEAHSGNALIAVQNNPNTSVNYSAVLQFVPPQSGVIKLTVTAIDGSGQTSDPFYVSLLIGTSQPLNDVDRGSLDNQSAPKQTNLTCTLNAAYEADITIPDNSIVTAGTNLLKTWRMRNSSQCAWDSGYKLVFIDGDLMGATGKVDVPPTARDASVDISVEFVAPLASGTYTSTWRVQSPEGTVFGSKIYLLIHVP